MNYDEIKALLINNFGEVSITEEERTNLQPALLVGRARLVAVCRELRDNSHTYFDFLSCITAIDFGADANKFGVVYHLSSIPYKNQLVIKVIQEHTRDTDNLPIFPSVPSVWRTAEWHEREA